MQEDASGAQEFFYGPLGLKYIDINGDQLDVANNNQSREDIKGMVKAKNQHYVTYDGDRLSLDFGKMSKKEINRTLRKDKGLKLLNEMSTAKEKYLYSATHEHGKQLGFSNNLEGPYSPAAGLYYSTTKLDGITVDGSTTNFTYAWFSNSSKTPRGDENELGVPFLRPTNASGYDAIVDISPGYISNLLGIKQKRSNYVRHELKESYLRTTYGLL